MEPKFVLVSIEKEESTETSTATTPITIKAYVHSIPFSQRLKNAQDIKFEKILDVVKELHINIPFLTRY